MASARDASQPLLLEICHSKVHGLGAFASRLIPRGMRIIEYLGERVTHQEADRRHASNAAHDTHTFLFIVDSRTVIENRRVFVEAIRTITPGEEMTYDYRIQREDDDPPEVDEVFACHCGFPECRGTMLWPVRHGAEEPVRIRSSSRRR